jgi:leucyl/phenylalanyl-tRNA--protein transferase
MELEPATLLSAYSQGVFPMADRDGLVRFYTADPRGLVPIDERFHVPQSLRQLMGKNPPVFDIRINSNFEATMRGCMGSRPDGTWINQEIINAYCRLNNLGFAHSVEAWQGGELVGGLYGVSLGGAFFGESMFHTSAHLRKFGAYDIPANDYITLLNRALKKRCQFA